MLVGICFFAIIPFFGQADSKILLANLKQDLELINREVASLRSEVEMLRRENAQLRVVVDQATRSQREGQESGQVLELQNRFQGLEFAFRQSERARGITQEEINKKFQQIIEQMNRGFEQVTQSSNSLRKPPLSPMIIPKTGLCTKLKRGKP